MQRRILAALVSVVAVLVPAGAASASSGEHHEGPGPRATTYLALGDSLAAGYQPGRGDNKTGGYVGDVLAGLTHRYHNAQLVNLACSGETAASMVAGGHCTTYPAGSQLAQAVDYLKAHRGRVSLITVDIGANDVQRCVSAAGIDMACVQAGLVAVHTNLTVIFSRLRAAAPGATIVALTYYDPFLAAWLLGSAGQALATTSLGLADTLNGEILAAARPAHVEIADVARAFSSHDMTLVPGPLPGTTVPKDVAVICQWTWMCTVGDIHANDAGYAVLGSTVLARLHDRGRED